MMKEEVCAYCPALKVDDDETLGQLLAVLKIQDHGV